MVFEAGEEVFFSCIAAITNLQPAQGVAPHNSLCCCCTQVFNVLAGMGYKWVIRLDTDSKLQDPVPYNLVNAMQERKAKYGFRTFSAESAGVVIGLPEAAQYWLVSQRPSTIGLWILDHCNPHDVRGVVNWNLKIIYNNFFITDISFWMQPEVQAWLSYLEYLRGAHKFRWGDAPVHTWTAGMFLKKEEMLGFCFAYQHQGTLALNQSDHGGFQSYPGC